MGKKYRLKNDKEKLAQIGPRGFWEIHNLAEPLPGTDQIFFAAMVILGEDLELELNWMAVRNTLSTPRRFLESCVLFDPISSKLTPYQLHRLKEYTSQATFTTENFSSKPSLW